ncbi:LEF-9 [Callinectes sapidus nudivirus]|nr:LEF-9 [Callinectes sapidus nudivirus]
MGNKQRATPRKKIQQDTTSDESEMDEVVKNPRSIDRKRKRSEDLSCRPIKKPKNDTEEDDDNNGFVPIEVSSEANPIKFKAAVTSLKEPVFPSLAYCLQPVTTENTLTVSVELLHNMIISHSEFYMCQTHSLSVVKNENCPYCTLFTKFTRTFILKTKYHYFTFPPPIWYSAKVLNFLKTFCASSYKYTKVKTMYPNEKSKEVISYSMFTNMDFNEGSLNSLSTGKTSYIRNNILASHTFGARATLTIDSTLSPQYVVFPQHIFDGLELACPLVIINRAPSLKNTCIYAVEVLRSDDPDDYTIRMNSYVTEGLHADQDGDELTIFYIKHPDKCDPSHETQLAITELKKFSWNGGIRHDFAYKPRYEFTQYLKYILYRYDDHFNKNNKLWASISGSVSEKCIKMMHLGCSIYPKEVDEFIEQVSEFVSKLDIQLSCIGDILNGTGTIEDVVLSGAKGEQLHIKTFLTNLYNLSPDRRKLLIDNFNNYIESGSKMSINGAYQFLSLESVNPMYLLDGDVFFNSKLLMKNIMAATAFAQYCYNIIASNHIFSYIANTCGTLVSDEEVDEYMKLLC